MRVPISFLLCVPFLLLVFLLHTPNFWSLPLGILEIANLVAIVLWSQHEGRMNHRTWREYIVGWFWLLWNIIWRKKTAI